MKRDDDASLADEGNEIIEPIEQEKESGVGEGDFVFTPSEHKKILVTDEELRNLQKELLDYKNKYLLGLADAENSRKRLQKERQEISRYAIENMIVDFLRPLDNLSNALNFAEEMSEEIRNWAMGFKMILTQFKDVLGQHGVNSFESVGKMFDPHDHEAIEMVESHEHQPGIIIEESICGYRLGDRTIRAARVKVAKAPE